MRSYRFEGDVCIITVKTKMHGEHEFLIDKEDYNRIKMFRWTLFKARERIYCSASIRRSGSILLHRLITSFEHEIVDHINNDPKDNRKCNLRGATHAQNMRNGKPQKNNKLGLKGVRWREKQKQFEANIWHNNKSIYIGLFKTKEAAALAYNEAALKYFGEFAQLNKVA